MSLNCIYTFYISLYVNVLFVLVYLGYVCVCMPNMSKDFKKGNSRSVGATSCLTIWTFSHINSQSVTLTTEGALVHLCHPKVTIFSKLININVNHPQGTKTCTFLLTTVLFRLSNIQYDTVFGLDR